MRLVRGLWSIDARFADGGAMTTAPMEYDQAAILAPMLGEEGVVRAILRPIPGTRAPWEYRAPFEASDPPRWGES